MPQKMKKAVSGTLAVVLAATAVGPLFTVQSAAFKSFDYIESLKRDTLNNKSSFEVIELVPDAEQTTMGYLAAGNEPLDIFARKAAEVEGWNRNDRKNYMRDVYSDLSGKGIIGDKNSTGYPLTKGDGDQYIEYFPWEVTRANDGEFYYKGEVADDGSPLEGAKRLLMLSLASADSDTVYGKFVSPAEGYEEGTPEYIAALNTGDYKMNASYSIAQSIFDFARWKSQFYLKNENNANGKPIYYYNNLPALTGLTALGALTAKDYIEFDDNSVTIVSDTLGTNTTGMYTSYATGYGYKQDCIEGGKTYEISFDLDITDGKKAHLYIVTYKWGSTSIPTLSSTASLLSLSSIQSDIPDELTESKHYTFSFTAPEGVSQFQLCLGVKSKNTTAKFSNIYIGEPRGYEQDTDRFIYADETYADTANDYWYDLTFTSISASDWETMDFNGVGIYEEDSKKPGTYKCVGVAGVDSAEELEIDYDKAMAGGYYTATINDNHVITGSDDKPETLLPVTETRDEYHTYRAKVKREEGTSNLAFKQRKDGGGYFKALDKTYTYTGDGKSDYIFKPNVEGSDYITAYTDTAYFSNVFTNNDLFKMNALDYVTGTDNFSVTVKTVTPESLNNTESLLGEVKVANMLVISAGTGTSISSAPSITRFTEDITEEVKDAILDAAGGTYKVPVAVDARLIDTNPVNNYCISETEQPVLFSLVNELIDKATENGGVSIIGGGVSANIYAFNPADIGGTASSIATKEITTVIPNADSESSPYYDVQYQIDYENNIRGTGNKLPNSFTNEASCFRCIINYKGRRIMGTLRNFRVLDIEPYTNDPQEEYYNPYSHETVPNKSYIDEYIIGSQWLPDKILVDKNGNRVTITEENAKDYITLTRMSTAELNGTGAKIVENYDLVYIGAAIGNLEKQASYRSGSYNIDYNDTRVEIKNKLYTSIGDAYTSGNIKYDDNFVDMVSGTVEGKTLAGLLDADYTSILGKGRSFSTSFIWPNHEFDLRTTGNDISRNVMDQLKSYAEAGFPVVFADDLVEAQMFEADYSVRVTAKLVYRGTSGTDHWGKSTSADGKSFKTNDAGSGSNSVYFAFVKAELLGDVPKGLIPEFKFKWAKNGSETGTKNTDYGTFYRSADEAKKNGVTDKMKPADWVEPWADDSKLNADKTARNWYSTLGDWNYSENYQNLDGNDVISGISLNKESDRGRIPYLQINNNIHYYCEVTFRLPKPGEVDYNVPVSEQYKEKFITSGLKLHSNEISFTNTGSGFDYTPDIDFDTAEKKNCIQTFTLTGKRTGNDKLAYVNINPNPRDYNVYVDYSELNWRHHARIGTYGDCGCHNGVHGTITNVNDGTMKITKTACDYAYLAIEGDINGEHSWDEVGAWSTGDRHGNYSCSWTSYITKYNVIPNSAWVAGATSSAGGVGTVQVKMKGNTRVEERTVDNTTYLYQFMSSVYNKVENTKDPTKNKEKLPSVFAASDLKEEDNRTLLGNRIQSIQAPKLEVDPYTLVSYPDPLPDRDIEVNFSVRNDKTEGSKSYEVHLYIDANHDAVFSYYEETPINRLNEGSTTIEDGLISSCKTGLEEHQYHLLKTVPSNYVGVIPWKLVVVDPNDQFLTDSYIGYAYRKAGEEGTVINAVQVLPADHWSNSVIRLYNAVGQEIDDYNNNNRYAVVKGMWRPTYDTSTITGSELAKSPFDSRTLAAAAEGNAYLGSVFLGTGAGRDGKLYVDDPDTSQNEEDQVWYLRENTTARDYRKKSNWVCDYSQADYANDAFYQLCLDRIITDESGKEITKKAKLDRTVYYDPMNELEVNEGGTGLTQYISQHYQDVLSQLSKDRLKYRTHVELWVNPEGEKVQKYKNGQPVYDYFGNPVMTYEKFDFEVDIALTDIYELDFYWYPDEDSLTSDGLATDDDFLSQFDMLILGFGDSYGKDKRQNGSFFNLSASTLGFNMYAAMAIRNYVDSGKPVLFCHDTTNGNVNYIDYYALNAVSWIGNIAQTLENFWNTTVKETATRVWYWFRNLVRGAFGLPQVSVDSPDIDQEKELNNKIADNRTRDGYYNNLILRYPLKLDRYGITYEIWKGMQEKKTATRTYWQETDFGHGHRFSYLIGTDIPQLDEDGNVKQGQYVTTAETAGVVTEPEMLAHGFTVAYEPSSAKRRSKATEGDEEIVYTSWPEGTPGGTRMIEGVEVPITFEGDQVKAEYIYETQGFTKWTIARYMSNSIVGNSSLANSYYMPITVPGNPTVAHRDPYVTSAITQVGKGSITSYPYDINTSAFGGTTDYIDYFGNVKKDNGKALKDGKIRIMPTHDQFYQINLNDGETTVWYCLADPSKVYRNTDSWEGQTCYDLLPNDCANSYYIFTSGNVTYTGAGHANIFTMEEAELFINTLVASYRASKEVPEVHFRDKTDNTNIEYQMLTKNDRNGSSSATSFDGEETGVKIIDPNITIGVEGDLLVNFYKDSACTQQITNIELHRKDENKTVSYTAGGYKVTSDVTYYFDVPDDVKNALKTQESYTIYAQASVGSDAVSTVSKLEYRAIGLASLS